MARVIALLNQKGGVGKTSTAYHLAGTWAKTGRSVLLIDNDPQASLTQGFWGPQAMREIEAAVSVSALFDPDQSPIPEALIRPTGFPGVSIVPGSRHLTGANMRPPRDWAETQFGMRDFLDEAREGYDLVVIDCPPNLHLCSWAALVASDFLVVPLQAEDFGSQGLAPVQEAIAAVQSGPNSGLRLAGYLLTMFDKRLTVHLTYEAMLREMYGSEVFTASIPRAKDFVEAVASRVPVSHYKPKSAAAKAVVAVANELVDRLEHGVTAVLERGAA
jgi:chromosome partitioning protein